MPTYDLSFRRGLAGLLFGVVAELGAIFLALLGSSMTWIAWGLAIFGGLLALDGAILLAYPEPPR